jgi:hypothetical protein
VFDSNFFSSCEFVVNPQMDVYSWLSCCSPEFYLQMVVKRSCNEENLKVGFAKVETSFIRKKASVLILYFLQGPIKVHQLSSGH